MTLAARRKKERERERGEPPCMVYCTCTPRNFSVTNISSENFLCKIVSRCEMLKKFF